MGGADSLTGGAGDDTIVGGGGADTLVGGTGTDTADYSTSGAGVTVYLDGRAGVGSDAQGDVLSAIGARIAVRTDTFRIRGYGETRDTTGKILARAWCEAIVQRVPDYVDPTDRPYTEYAKMGEVNKKFGRHYQIVSFRWLGPKEV